MTALRSAALAGLCAALAACGQGAFHPCSSDRDCPVPQTCAGGICAASACGVGAPTCIDDGACGTGQHCAAGCCVAGASGSCSRDADCSSLPATPVCDATQKRCVECVTARDCGPGRTCTGNACAGTPGCYTSSDCKDPQKPLCNVVNRTCVECLQGSDCPDPARPNCDVSHTCVGNPKCTGDRDCADPTLPKCAPDGSCVLCLTKADCTGGLDCSPQHQCVPPTATTCVSDQDCASNPAGTHCKPGTATTPGACVACVTDDQCPPGDSCAGDNTCQIKQCNSDGDCTNPATPKCLTTASPRVCVACLASGDCPNGGTCQADHTCQAPQPKCKTDNDCAANVAAPHCKLVTGGANLCVACRLPGDCGAGQTCPNDCGPGQLCNASNTCALVACQQDGDCTDPKKPHCQPGTGGADGTCVQCVNSTQCQAGEKCAGNACAPICTAATEKTDCAAPTPKCKESPSGNSCVQCVADADCPTATPKCSANNTCINPPPPGCASNADCPAGQHVCDTSQTPHACVQCLVTADCTGSDLCDPATKTCSPPPVGGEGQPCKADDTCDTGLLCVDEGGAAPVCRRLCDPYAATPCSAAAAGTVCEWLGFDSTNANAFFGICEPKNGHGAAGAACDPGQVDSCEWNLVCVPGSATAGVCKSLCKPGSSCTSGSCNAIVGALDSSRNPLSFGWCGTTTTWGRACITDTGSAGADCGSALSTAGTTGLFCTPAVLPAEVPPVNIIATCQYTPAVATATGGANVDCSAIGGNACRTGLCLSDGPASCFAGCQFNADCSRDGGSYCFDVKLFGGSATGTVGSCEPTCRDNADCRSTAACAPLPNHGGDSWRAVCAPPAGAGKGGSQCTGGADCQSGVCVTAATLQSIGLGQGVSGFTATDGFCLGSCLPTQAGDCAGAGTTCRIDPGLPLSPRTTGDLGVAGRPNPGVCWGASCTTDANCSGSSADANVPRVCAPFKVTTMASVDSAKKCTLDTDCAGSTSWLAICNTATVGAPGYNPNPGGVYGSNAGIYGPDGRCRGITWAQHCAPGLIADPAKGGPGAACTFSTDCKTGHCVVSGTNKYCFGGCATDADCLNGTHCKTDNYLGLTSLHCAP